MIHPQFTLATTALLCLLSTQSQATESLSDALISFNGSTLVSYCSSQAGPSFVQMIVEVPNYGYFYLPSWVPAQVRGDTYVVEFNDGYAVIDQSNFMSLRDGIVKTANCVDAKNIVKEFISMAIESSPEAISALATSVRIETLEFQLSEANQKIIDYKKAADEATARLSDQMAAEASNLELNRLRRENAKIKLRICELDPKATFSACKGSGTTPNP